MQIRELRDQNSIRNGLRQHILSFKAKYMKKQSHIIPAILLVITAGSVFGCITYPADQPYYVSPERQLENVYYTPTTPNIPLLHKKNSFMINAHYGGNKDFKNFDFQTAFMPGKKFGLMAAMRNSEYKEKDYYELGYSRGIEFGAGYIAPSKSNLHFEAYGGIGTTGVYNKHYTGESKINFTSYFIQPAFSVKDNKNVVEFSLIPRFALNRFNIQKQDYNFDRERLVDEQFTLIKNNPSQYFFEPTALVRLGWESVKFQFTYTYSKNLTSGKLHAAGNNLSFGMLFTTK